MRAAYLPTAGAVRAWAMTLAHQTDEYCAGEKIEEAANIYEAIARRWSET